MQKDVVHFQYKEIKITRGEQHKRIGVKVKWSRFNENIRCIVLIRSKKGGHIFQITNEVFGHLKLVKNDVEILLVERRWAGSSV